MTKDYVASLTVDDMADVLASKLTRPETNAAFASEIVLIDRHRIDAPACTVVSLVFRTWFVRIRGFLTLVVTLSNETGSTKVHIATGGHLGFFGEGSAFVKTVEKVLLPHILGEGDMSI